MNSATCKDCSDIATEFYTPTGAKTTRGYCRSCYERRIVRECGSGGSLSRLDREINKRCGNRYEERDRKQISSQSLGGTTDMTPTGEDDE